MALFHKTLALSRCCSVIRKGTRIGVLCRYVPLEESFIKAAQSVIRGSRIIKGGILCVVGWFSIASCLWSSRRL